MIEPALKNEASLLTLRELLSATLDGWSAHPRNDELLDYEVTLVTAHPGYYVEPIGVRIDRPN